MADMLPVRSRKTTQVETATVDVRNYLTFLLGGESYGIDILSIREIIEYAAPTEVPLVPPFIRGVMNLRGAVVPVIDLSLRFGRGATEARKRTCIVIMEVKHEEAVQQIGIVVDAVQEVIALPLSEIEPPPNFGTRIRADFVSGMGKVDGKFILLLNVQKVLSIDEMAMLAGLSERATEGPDAVVGA
jgi:purine-binding chemotaxis protein CheW